MRTYEIRSGRRTLTVRDASTPQHAVLDYLKSMGCRDGEIVRLASDGVSWRGAVYTAVPVADDAVAPRSVLRPSWAGSSGAVDGRG